MCVRASVRGAYEFKALERMTFIKMVIHRRRRAEIMIIPQA